MARTPRVFEVSAELAAETGVNEAAGVEVDYIIRDPDVVADDGTVRKGAERTVTFIPPDVSVLVMLIARVEASTNMQMAGTMINTFFSMLHNDDDVRYFNGRLFNSKDPFSAAHIAKIMSDIVEGWSGNPTDGSSGSSGSPSRSGKHSRKRQHGRTSTPGTAPSAAGSPSSTDSSSVVSPTTQKP